MGAIAQYVKRAADQGGDFNGSFPFTDIQLKMTVKATVEILGEARIVRISFWNQETKERLSVVLNDGQEEKSEGLRNTGSVFVPGERFLSAVAEGVSGAERQGQRQRETKVEEDLTNSGEKSTEVEKMSLANVEDFLVDNAKVEETAEQAENKGV